MNDDILKSLRLIEGIEKQVAPVNEATINELSKDTLKSYNKKAVGQIRKGEVTGDKADKRETGAFRAQDRIFKTEKAPKAYREAIEDHQGDTVDIKGFSRDIADMITAQFGEQGFDFDFRGVDDFQEFLLDSLGSEWEDVFSELDVSYQKMVMSKVKKLLDQSSMGRGVGDDDRGTLKGGVREEDLSEVSDEKVYRHKGSYGTSYDGDSDEKKAAEPAVKRGRGRPKKGSDNSGEVKKYDWSAFGGKVNIPKHKGEVRKHKMVGETGVSGLDMYLGPEGKPMRYNKGGDMMVQQAINAIKQAGYNVERGEVTAAKKVGDHFLCVGYDGNEGKWIIFRFYPAEGDFGAHPSGSFASQEEAMQAFSKMNEGNQFSGALAKAKAAGEENFEVGGKTYKVNEVSDEKVYRHKGNYGTSYDGDADEKKAAEPAVKRGRGRPKKGSDNSGEVKKYDFSAFTKKVPVGKHSGGVTKHKMIGEGSDSAEACASAITRRIMLRHVDLLAKHGPEAVMNAIEDVCSGIGELDEIGSSDVSAWVDRVRDILGEPTMNESLVLKRAIGIISEAVVLEKKMTDEQKKKREEIVKGMKKDKKGFEKRYGKKAKDVMYATATKQAVKESTDPVLSITESTFRKISSLFENVNVLSADTLDGLYDGSIDIEDALQNGTGLRAGEQDALVDMYNVIANENGLHPDDDFEQIYDLMMGEIEQAVIHGDFEPDSGDDELTKEPMEEGSDSLMGRIGMNRVNKFPRAGQTDMGNIPAGNHPDSANKFSDEYRSGHSNRIKQAIMKAMGSHGPKGVLPEAKSDPLGGWVAHKGDKMKKFKTREGAKAYADKNAGYKVSSSEGYEKSKKVDEAAKPDFLDVDKDGDKKEPMKKAITDKKKIDESCGMPDQAGGQEKIDLTPTLLIDLLKLAGLGNPASMTPYAPVAAAVTPDVPAMPAPAPEMELPAEIPMEEDGYSNSPDEEYGDLDSIVTNGDDLHKHKNTYPKVAGGDNPRQHALAEDLWNQYQKLKNQVK